jgi:hypothetical protein
LRPQQRAAGPIKRPERLRPLAHCGMRSCRSGEVRCAGESGVRAGQTQPTMSEGEGQGPPYIVTILRIPVYPHSSTDTGCATPSRSFVEGHAMSRVEMTHRSTRSAF